MRPWTINIFISSPLFVLRCAGPGEWLKASERRIGAGQSEGNAAREFGRRIGGLPFADVRSRFAGQNAIGLYVPCLSGGCGRRL